MRVPGDVAQESPAAAPTWLQGFDTLQPTPEEGGRWCLTLRRGRGRGCGTRHQRRREAAPPLRVRAAPGWCQVHRLFAAAPRVPGQGQAGRRAQVPQPQARRVQAQQPQARARVPLVQVPLVQVPLVQAQQPQARALVLQAQVPLVRARPPLRSPLASLSSTGGVCTGTHTYQACLP